MTIKIFGAILIIAGCGGMGFSFAHAHRREEKSLQSLLRAIELMICELEYRLTPLPELVRLAGAQAQGIVGETFLALANCLEENTQSDAAACMAKVLLRYEKMPWRTRQNLQELGYTLGRFALSGQVSGFQAVAILCKRDLDSLAHDREARLRGYGTLGLCAGVALVILFF